MKMLIKLEKDPNVSLHSERELEEDKGKGKRHLKKTTKRCMDSEKQSTQQHNRKEQALSPVSKLRYQKKGCKIPQNVKHECAYNEQGEATLQSVADAICFLNGMVKISYVTSFC